MLQCVAVCCSVVTVQRGITFGNSYCSIGALQHVAVCCSVLQRDAMRRSVLQCGYREEGKNFWQFVSFHACVAVCCSMLQCVAVCRSVLQYVAVWCNVLQCVAMCCSVVTVKRRITFCNVYRPISTLHRVAVCYSVLQRVAVWLPSTEK